MNPITVSEQRLKRLTEDYYNSVKELAMMWFRTGILPYAKENNYNFYAGRGVVWLFLDKDGQIIQPAMIDGNIRKVLNIFVNEDSILSDYMPDWEGDDEEI